MTDRIPHLTSIPANWRPEEASPWKPIESAPKDGTPILAYHENIGWEYFVVKWIDGKFFTLDSDYNPFWYEPPTHWMPLPPPPPVQDDTK